ncbi:NAD(P)H-quinone oxidoreductase [Sphingobium lactosutens]|uniref:NAD(P)H-quinone oxidoreductase n=1 Tax=Sphingobium lactosutens TaxID=522773 RepID=UPI0015BBF96B|nr:NAD(P)H-quinone oxidoreductase [Sphingobium lactosutens]NWK99127.1 NAD(P)H-quinone oxidoreductase [Sphingobium lactosutens]
MRAIKVRGGTGAASALFEDQVAMPAAGPGEILIKVAASGVNRPDISQREGNYPPPPGASTIIGLEVAGEVAALGEGAQRWSIGDRVTALLPGGGYAEYAVVDSRHALPVPDGMSCEQAAGLPETVFTVWTNLFERGRLAAGETALIHGGNSGIGVTAIQMAKAAGARVIATCRGKAKTAKALEVGADIAIDVLEEDFAAVVTEAGGADVVLDIAGGSYFEGNIAALKPDGRLAQIALLDGGKVSLDLTPLLFKRLTITGSTLRARPADEKARLARAIEEHVWPWVRTGQVSPPIDRTFLLAQAGDAHEYLESGSQFGKIVLVP